nr:unnamed protein product [Digitaria exilis]
MASRTAVSALPWHQYSDAHDALDVDRRAGVAAAASEDLDDRVAEENTLAGARRSALALRHSGARNRRYLSSSLRVAIRGGLASPGRRCEELKLITEEAGVLRAVWNAGDDPADSSSGMPLGSSQGRRRLSSEKTSPALARSGEHAPAAHGGARSKPPSSDDVHRIEKSSSGSMSMKDAVELLNDSPRPAAWTSRRSKDRGAHRGALLLGHPPREKLSLREGEASMEERAGEGSFGEARRAGREWRDEDDIGGR